ncbi:MAG: hypothetical protein JXD21_07260 [Candidatus Omnitrophica bacterium]|nr:hypothetical protein [Candidatus Omnitrophota bacterium]
MKIGKLLLAGVAVTIFNAIAGMVTCAGIFNWVYKLEPTNVWKPMDSAPGAGFFIGSLVISIILALVYALIRKGLPGKNKLTKGFVFGLCVWAVGILPGMFATYSFMTVAPTVVLYWTIMGLIQTPLEGMIIAAIYGE